jgi:serine/threonine protein kinase
MALNAPSVISQIKTLGTKEAIQADPRFAPFMRNVYPLTGKAGNLRRTKKTLGKGTFGQVNLEELNEGNVATKYFLDPITTMLENVSEVAALRYIKGEPNVAQLIRVDQRPTSLLVNEIAPSLAPDLQFPAVVLGKAKSTLSDMTLYTSWDDVYSAIVQILRGYYTLHSRGIVHRDTKPQNMLMTAAGEVLISDFGTSKYLDTFLPITKDNYTGTIWYTAPELLMKSKLVGKHHENYKKSDAWAVGASIVHLLRQSAIFRGANAHEVLTLIFFKKGTPDATDGELYPLYQDYVSANPILDYPKVSNRFRDSIRDTTVYPPSDPAILEAVVDMVAGLLEYDPARRLSIGEALQRLPSHSGLPVVPPRVSLRNQYIQKRELPAPYTAKMLDILFGWLHEVVHHKTLFNTTSKHAVLDRTGVYLYSFLYTYAGNSYLTTNNLQLIGCVALLLAASFFDISPFPAFADIYQIRIMTTKAYTVSQIMECIKMFMVSDIDYYGRTFFDDLLLAQPSLTREEIETYAFLNYACFQKNLFAVNADIQDILQDEFVAFVKTFYSIPVLSYLANKSLIGVGDRTIPTIQEFIYYVTPMGGGKQRQKTTKRVKRGRHNKTLKVRNGRF